MKRSILLFLVAIATPLLAIPLGHTLDPQPIPREPARHFQNQGFFRGGTETRVNLESIRLAQHQDEFSQKRFERWVIDFSAVGTRVLNAAAPHFQLRYFPAENGESTEGKSARFVFLFQSVQDCFLSQAKLKQLTKKSHLVKDIILYPQIEKGDMALELDLKEDVAFEAHQPREREGRLVLDVKANEASLP